MPAFSLEQAPPLGHPAASPPARRSPTQHTQNHYSHHTAPHQNPKALTGSVCGNVHCHDFGGVLEPRYIIGAESLDQ